MKFTFCCLFANLNKFHSDNTHSITINICLKRKFFKNNILDGDLKSEVQHLAELKHP